MKVLMLGWEFPPFFSGGLGVVTKNLAISLGKRDLEVCFALPYYVQKKIPNHVVPDGVYLADFNNVSNQVWDSITINYFETMIPHAYSTPEEYEKNYQEQKNRLYAPGIKPDLHDKGEKAVYGKNLWREIDRFAYQMEAFAEGKDFDVIHAHDWITFEAGIRLKTKLGVPLLLHVHATEMDRTGGAINEQVFNREKYALEFCDRIVAVSHYTRQILIDSYGIDPDKIYVVHNAHNVESLPHTDPPNWLKKKEEDDFVVLFIGRLTLQKGPDYFIDVAKRVLKKNKKVKFVLAGTGDMYERIMNEIAEERLQNNIFCLGFMSGKDKEDVYRNADLCLIPSVSEPFGLIALEAVEYGVPVLISTNSGAQEVLYHSLKSDFWDVPKMADYVLALQKYPALRKMLVEQSYIETRNLSWDSQAEKLHDIYNQLTQL